jgi:NADH-quinone oxidoreductase subunit J
MVLFLFVVMMLDVDVAAVREGFTRYAPIGILVALIVIAEIGSVIWTRHLGLDLVAQAPARAADYSNTRELGTLLYSEYLYPLELAAVILLVAIVAAIVLTMRHRSGYKAQDVTKQVAVQARDRIRILKMDAEKRS